MYTHKDFKVNNESALSLYFTDKIQYNNVIWDYIHDTMDLPNCDKMELVEVEFELDTYPGELIDLFVRCYFKTETIDEYMNRTFLEHMDSVEEWSLYSDVKEAYIKGFNAALKYKNDAI
jgi:hypothetical protein